MTRLRRLVVWALERACCLTHPITLHDPWLRWFSNCPLASLAFRLADRWEGCPRCGGNGPYYEPAPRCARCGGHGVGRG